LEHGWSTFSLEGRKAHFLKEASPQNLGHQLLGYLVGDRLVPREVKVDPENIACSERVHLIEPGLDRFAYISAGRMCEDGPLFYVQQEMPLGPETEVQSVFLDGKESIADIKGVSPALDAAFQMEVFQRKEAERRRQELEERLRLEEEERQREAKRRELFEKLGDGASRREMAKGDFEAAARAALAIGGSELLDHRRAPGRDEMIVRFRLDHQRFECTCHTETLRIIDAGICLTDESTGEKGDSFLTLESLPAVILEAQRLNRLVIFRHV
jgi:PAS domain-containing protein